MRQHTCTTFLAGKEATIDGSTIVCRVEDYSNDFDPQRFVVVTPEKQSRHYKSKTTDFTIDLSGNPLRYTSTPDADSSAGIFGASGINSANVSMTATETITSNSRILSLDPYNQESGIGEEDFLTLVLPYVRTARQAVERVGQLLTKYGTYEANGLAFGDQNEVWYLETIGGHHWAAIKVPDNAYVIAPNRLNITDFDFSANETLCSADLKELIDLNHLNPEENHYNLRLIFGSSSYRDAHYNNPRAWYVEQQLSGAQGTKPIDQMLPFINYPRHKITIQEIKEVMSSHYQDTDYDPYLSKGAPYRSIALNRNLELHILQIRNNVDPRVSGVQWLAFGPNTVNAVVPFYANVKDTPKPYRDTAITFDINNIYWLNHVIMAIADQHYQKIEPLLEDFSEQVMTKTLICQHQTDNAFTKKDDVAEFLTKANEQMATISYQESMKLLGKLVEYGFKNARLQY
ncbi:MAG: C69 family dipeptidase [Limosilactobacillus sp.]|jgi:dipeptidase|uniref:C69 family dipeptidase n=1 Tax=Limosilactobacillus sp. TaxID=2773925 RepID=UPI0025BB03EC|nr:C69 family dipeptidase [Limosilactobacillus sp.]MCI1975285.1 C69 family dipeptidase [Limosilactobacillus sp.]MCI2031449.1 C69 family dipeptidase [Limosilactobacillus sp.]